MPQEGHDTMAAQLRITITVELTPEANVAVDQVCTKMGMHKKVVVSRILQWFADQPQDMTGVILGLVSHHCRSEVLRMLAEQEDRLAATREQATAGRIAKGKGRAGT